MQFLRYGVLAGLLACVAAEGTDDTDPGPGQKPDTGPPNEPPVAFSNQIEEPVPFGGSVLVDLVEDDYDPDGDLLDLVEVGVAGLGTVELVDTTTVRYTHTSEAWGGDFFEYTITDGRGGSAYATAYLEVAGPAQLGVLEPQDGATLAAGPVVVRFAVEGCELGSKADTGCFIAPTLDGEVLDRLTTDAVAVATDIDGEHTLTATLVARDGTPLQPKAQVSVTWTTTGGRDPWEYPGDVTLSSAAAMSDLCTDGFTAVLGDVIIDTASATDVTGLSCLTRVNGDLVVEKTSLQTLELPDLEQVGGATRLLDNAELLTTTLPALETVGNQLVVDGSPQLTALDLGGLVSVGDRLSVDGAPFLSTIDLSSLQFADELLLNRLTSLSDVTLPQLTTVDGKLEVWATGATILDAPRLETVGTLSLLEGSIPAPNLPNLRAVLLDVRLVLTGVQTLGLPSLESVGQELRLLSNPNLATLSLPALRSVGAATLQDDPVLGSVDLSALQIADAVRLRDLDGLQTFELPDLVASNVLSVVDCGFLEHVGAPDASWVGTVRFDNDDALTSFDLGSVDTIGAGKADELYIGGNELLADHDGLGALTRIVGSLTIVDNPSLPTAVADALADSVTVQHQVTIKGNL